MLKKCILCGSSYEVTWGSNIKKRKFCSIACKNKYWLIVNNKSGKFRENVIIQGNHIRKTQKLSDEQNQFIIGTLLGDSSLDITEKGSIRLKFQHTEKNLDYVLLKSKILKNFIIRENPIFCKSRKSKPFNGRVVETKSSYFNYTTTHQDFRYFYQLFYKHIQGKRKKIFKKELCNLITPFTLLFWYMDDGTLGHAKSNYSWINLCTNNFTLNEHKIIISMFHEKYNLNPKIYFIKNQQNYYIRFNKSDTEKIMSIFEPLKQYIPLSMNHKFTFFRQLF